MNLDSCKMKFGEHILLFYPDVLVNAWQGSQYTSKGVYL